MLLRIDNCGECPAFVRNINTGYCLVHEASLLIIDRSIVEDWCPLREREVRGQLTESHILWTEGGEDADPCGEDVGCGYCNDEGCKACSAIHAIVEGVKDADPCGTCGGSGEIPVDATPQILGVPWAKTARVPCPDCKEGD